MSRMRELREGKGWTRGELARRARMDAATVGKIESGRLQPYPKQLVRLAKALQIPAADAATLVNEVAADDRK